MAESESESEAEERRRKGEGDGDVRRAWGAQAGKDRGARLEGMGVGGEEEGEVAWRSRSRRRKRGGSQPGTGREGDGDVRAYRAGLSKVQRNFHSWWACRMVWALFRAHVSWVSLGVRPRPDREWWMHYMRASAEFARARQHNPVPPFGPVVFTQNVK